MKISIVGSMQFAKEMVEAKKFLVSAGHEVFMPEDTGVYSATPGTKLDYDTELKHASENDALRKGFDRIHEADAVLVLNYPKNGVSGYIGASSLMEIGVAFFLKKPVYLLYPFEKSEKYSLELELIGPVILSGAYS